MRENGSRLGIRESLFPSPFFSRNNVTLLSCPNEGIFFGVGENGGEERRGILFPLFPPDKAAYLSECRVTSRPS